MELLTTLRDGSLTLDRLDDATLEKIRGRVGTRAMSRILADRPEAEAAGAVHAAGPAAARRSTIASLKWPLALAATLALGVTTFTILNSPGGSNLGAPGTQPSGEDAPIVFHWPQDRALFVPDSRLALGSARAPIATEMPDWTKDAMTLGGTPPSPARQKMQLSTVIVTFPSGFGSGAIISEDGWILTNYHVVEDDVQKAALEGRPCVARVFLPRVREGRIEKDPNPVEATVFRCDPHHDLALLKLNDIPASARPLHHFTIADKVEPGDACIAIGSKSKGPAWMLLGGNVASIFSFPDGLSDEVIRQTGSVAAQVDRMRAEVICTDISISPGDSGGPLLNENGQLIGLTFATPSNLSSGSLGYHVSLRHIRAFIASLPKEPESSPPDLWQVAWPDALRQGPTAVDIDQNESVEALRFNYSVQVKNDKGESSLRPVGVAIFADLESRETVESLDKAEDYMVVIPRGMWGMEDRGQYKWHVSIALREDGKVFIGYPDAAGLMTEVRMGAKGGQNTERAWGRDARGAWHARADLIGKPLVEPSKVDKKHRAMLAKLSSDVFGGQKDPEPDKPMRPRKPGLPGKPPAKPAPTDDKGGAPNKMKGP